jgi:hypothetical protein
MLELQLNESLGMFQRRMSSIARRLSTALGEERAVPNQFGIAMCHLWGTAKTLPHIAFCSPLGNFSLQPLNASRFYPIFPTQSSFATAA